jgi:3-methyladenine DNA glycosylase/8-oxoguanine DNA glycosylase
VRAVLGQQVTVKGAATLARRFVEALGDPIETPDARLDRLFPRAEAIAATDPARSPRSASSRAARKRSSRSPRRSPRGGCGWTRPRP